MSATAIELDRIDEVADARQYAIDLAGPQAVHLDGPAFDEVVASATAAARTEVLVFAASGLDVDALARFAAGLRAVADRGVACLEVLDGRLFTDAPAAGVAVTTTLSTALTTVLATALVAGLGLRESPVPFPMRLVDGTTVLLPATDGEGGIMIESTAAARFLRSLFVAHWRRGDRVRAVHRSGRLPVELIDVLQEIAAGRTDDRAAARLGLSLRTYRRRVDDLMHMLGVQSRFQAGAEAARRGLLDFLPADPPLRG